MIPFFFFFRILVPTRCGRLSFSLVSASEYRGHLHSLIGMDRLSVLREKFSLSESEGSKYVVEECVMMGEFFYCSTFFHRSSLEYGCHCAYL